jgi:hypothetical protein
MKFSKKLAIVAIPAAMALSAPEETKSKLLLMSQEGWEVSFDGAANAFYTFNDSGEFETPNGVGTREGDLAITDEGEQSSNIQVGLLPNVWGMTLKAPTTGGLDMEARLGLYTHINGGTTAGGWNNNGLINNRETSFSVSGDFGTVLFGRTLRLFQQNAIVKDQTLFGVGTLAGDSTNTTLGRIGAGYLYANFGEQIQWTTPGLGPIGFRVSVNGPTDADGDTTNFESPYPAFQFLLDASFSAGGVDAGIWVDGHYQYSEFTTAGAQVYQTRNGLQAGSSGGTGNTDAPGFRSNEEGVDIAGGGAGLTLGYGPVSIVGAGFFSHGMGGKGLGYSDGFDAYLNPINYAGAYGQVNLDLGGGTNVGYSYGGNFRAGKSIHAAEAAASTNPVILQSHHNGMIWHNVNDHFRLIAEYGHTAVHYHQAGNQKAETISLGAFFFW